MRITGIETLPVSVGAGYDFAVILVLVRTDEGLTGIGEASLAGRGRGVVGILDHFAELLVGQGPGPDRALVERADPRYVLVERPGDHERRRRDRHRPLGPEGEAARRSRLRPARRADAREGARLPPPRGRQCRGARRGRAALARAGLYRAPFRAARGVRRAGPDPVGSAGLDRADDRSHRAAAHRARRRRRPDPRRPHDVQPRRGGLPRPCPRALPALLLRGPDPAAQPVVAAARARQGEPAHRDGRAARAQVGVPAADRGRARRLPAHRHGARGRDHGGEEDPRHGRGPRPALGAAPRELPGQRRRLPPRRHGGAELRDPGVDGAGAALRALPECAACGGRLRRRRPTAPGLGLELDEAEARRRPSRDAPLPSRSWPDGGVADY